MTESASDSRNQVRLDALRAELEPIEPLKNCDVVLPRNGVIYRILQPDYIDMLLDAIEEDPEQNLPYWAEIWPSGIALADAILSNPEMVAGRRVLEIGCGIGITATAALAAGADLTVADYAPESLRLCRYNTLVNAGREPQTIQINWRAPSPELFQLAGDGFPIVLAADVLYETRDIDPLLSLVERLVAPGGLLWLADPGRAVADRFLEAAAEPGWLGVPDLHTGPWPDPKDDDVKVRVHRLTRRA